MLNSMWDVHLNLHWDLHIWDLIYFDAFLQSLHFNQRSSYSANYKSDAHVRIWFKSETDFLAKICLKMILTHLTGTSPTRVIAALTDVQGTQSVRRNK